MHLRHLTMHLGQDGVAPAESNQRKLGEDQRKRGQGRAHEPTLRATAMLSGASTRIVGTSGRWKPAMAVRQTTAKAMGIGRRQSGRAILMAIAASRPAAAAARPANMWTTCGSDWKRA